MPHVRLVRLEVQLLAARQPDDFPKLQIVINLLPDAADVRIPVASRVQFILDVGVGTNQSHGALVQRVPLRLPFLQVGGDFGVAAEVADVLQFVLRRLHRLAEQRERLDSIVEAFPALAQAVLQ